MEEPFFDERWLLRGKGDGTHAWEGKGSTQGVLIAFPENRGTISLRSPLPPCGLVMPRDAESPEQAGPLRPRGQCGGGEHSDGGLDPPGSSASPLFKGLSGSVTLISKA